MRLTTAQALIRFLAARWTERDGVEQRLIEGCPGISGHGNVADPGWSAPAVRLSREWQEVTDRAHAGPELTRPVLLGYEVAGGLGVKLAAPERAVLALAGDGSYLMMAQEIATAVQEGVDLVVVLAGNGGFASIGALSEAVGATRTTVGYAGTGPEAPAWWDVPVAEVAGPASVRPAREDYLAAKRDQRLYP